METEMNQEVWAASSDLVVWSARQQPASQHHSAQSSLFHLISNTKLPHCPLFYLHILVTWLALNQTIQIGKLPVIHFVHFPIMHKTGKNNSLSFFFIIIILGPETKKPYFVFLLLVLFWKTNGTRILPVSAPARRESSHQQLKSSQINT